jgi:zinc transporter ZupT
MDLNLIWAYSSCIHVWGPDALVMGLPPLGLFLGYVLFMLLSPFYGSFQSCPPISDESPKLVEIISSKP